MSSASNSSSTSGLTGEDAAIVFGVLDVYFNEIVVYALMHGIYTCILAITLWNIFSSKTAKSGASRVLMVFAIVLLYILSTIAFAFLWFFVRFGFIDNGQDALSVFTGLTGFNSQWTAVQIGVGVTGIIGTIIADGAMIWRCYVVWGGRWLIVLIPSLCLITETIVKSLQVYHNLHDVIENDELSEFGSRIDWTTLYLSLILATTLMCTLLIVYRILSVGGIKAGLRTYRGVVEVVVESAALYSIALIIYIAFISRNTLANSYIDVITASIKGIAPTLLVGRVAAGHARPNDTWKESRLSSLHFGNPRRTQMSTMNSTTGGAMQSVMFPDAETNPGNDSSSDRIAGHTPEAKLESV
ncbi:uncharacterized protein EV420DRAFT_789263 [Desarmillaria tabescens]|uniref:Uncharacterized protein n=1 Tax=Armillaria tabescens TaxID=1929756 RepID=A0AA39JWF2_ARMTA|nr:uncharacterized protein EV420DRAFT_789263 [Desarmillaria tabescens]KAK0449055.1 hypothetical protein EV420DRAFT_789263 [Desarmillaria tabescens]